ncbi:MAG: hypothetical protein ACXW2E_00130 [Nitrososphaeraceae archaeon]
MLIFTAAFQDEYSDPSKVTFDGEQRLIVINSPYTNINIKQDIYSSWKRWITHQTNAKWPAAIRTTGGDPIGGGVYTGDVYFLINNWQIYVDRTCTIEGVLYSDNYPSPFVQVNGTHIVTNKVSSLVTTVAPTIDNGGITIPTASDIATAVWNENTSSHNNIGTFGKQVQNPTLTATEVTDAVWNEQGVEHTALGSFGLMINQIRADTSNVMISQTALTTLINTLLKYERNRTKIDKNQYTLTVYDNDGITPLTVFNLKDNLGNPSINEVFERNPTEN